MGSTLRQSWQPASKRSKCSSTFSRHNPKVFTTVHPLAQANTGRPASLAMLGRLEAAAAAKAALDAGVLPSSADLSEEAMHCPVCLVCARPLVSLRSARMDP